MARTSIPAPLRESTRPSQRPRYSQPPLVRREEVAPGCFITVYATRDDSTPAPPPEFPDDERPTLPQLPPPPLPSRVTPSEPMRAPGGIHLHSQLGPQPQFAPGFDVVEAYRLISLD